MRKLCSFLTIILVLFACSKEEEVITPPAPNKYTLTITADAGGSVSSPGGTYNEGSKITITATPDGQYLFEKWSDGSTVNPREITVTSNLTLSATFVKKTYPLSVTIEGEGTVQEEVIIQGSTSQTEHKAGTTVRLTATPNEGWIFAGWSGDVESDALEIEVPIEKGTSVSALFKRSSFELNITIEGEGTVKEEVIVQPGQYDYESIVRLIPIPNENWEFKWWRGEVQSFDSIIEVPVEATIEVTARFIDKSLFLNDSTGTYFSNWIEDYDVISTPEYHIIHPENLPPHNVTIVSKEDGHPVRGGDRSIRINWFPGDCGQWPGGIGWKDCDNKRGRSEIGDTNSLTFQNGPKIGWSFSVYFPEAKYIIPPDGVQTVIFQIYHTTDNWLKPLLFLKAEPDGSISVTDHKPFTNEIISKTTIIQPEDVFDQWHDIEVSIEFIDLDNAKVTFMINNEVVHSFERDMANQGDGELAYSFRTGFYNGYFHNPRGWEGWTEQLMYVDNIKKKDNSDFD